MYDSPWSIETKRFSVSSGVVLYHHPSFLFQKVLAYPRFSEVTKIGNRPVIDWTVNTTLKKIQHIDHLCYHFRGKGIIGLHFNCGFIIAHEAIDSAQ